MFHVEIYGMFTGSIELFHMKQFMFFMFHMKQSFTEGGDEYLCFHMYGEIFSLIVIMVNALVLIALM
jgi:hypothetical protein